ncbi:type I-F CRISPR-associated protein Csy1 [Isoalcanivorax beigongshangi]|uniref:Type I-F CRISPR-associated protein Csy1 n=1 Tax=Isoalcanivorax beigongshangi TaxID=3238810 RepID=A0ABV4AIV7_9GAMM
MNNNPMDETAPSFRAAVDRFIQERRDAKLDKLKDDDPKRADILTQHQRDPWLDDAARRVRQIQAVTHSLKPIHPDARGTNLYVMPSVMAALDEVGSHVLGEQFVSDVVGNAAALDVYKLLRLEVDGQSLLQALEIESTDALSALSDDPLRAKTLRDAFVSLTGAREESPGSHTHAKQLYWLIGDDPVDDAQYHLLAPLYATSLAHNVHAVLQEHRFGDANKQARQAYRDRNHHDGTFHHYPNIAVQKLGGTKPQNISQLNSERGGINYLLSSLPPTWKASEFRVPIHTRSVFERIYAGRPAVRRTVQRLRTLLESDPERNSTTRDRVEALVERLIDELNIMAAGFLQALPPGWSRGQDCQELVREEQLWLDPLRAELPDEAEFAREWLWMDWPDAVGHRFGQWLNARLEGKHVFGDAELRHWKKQLRVDESDAGWAHQLHCLRQKLEVPQAGDQGSIGEVSA